MVVNAYSSSSFDSMVARLINGVQEERSRYGNTIEQWRRRVTLVVPSLDMGAIVEQRMARLAGVAVNVEVQTLQDFMTRRIESALGNGGGDGPTLLDRESIKGLLLRCFRDLDCLPEEARDPIVDYLHAVSIGGEGDEIRRRIMKQNRETRQYQLARTLATVFEEYIYSRPAMLDRWCRGEHQFQGGDDELVAEIEVWQAALWRRLVDADYGPTMTEAFDGAVESIAAELGEESTGALHVFGFAGMGNALLESLAGLGENGDVDVHFYFYSPVDDPMDMGDGDGHRALELWSTVGGDTARQLDEIADGGLEILDGTQRGDGDGILGKIQESVATNTPGIVEAKPDEDKNQWSLRFLDCPGVRRELEVVANDIWDRMNKTKETDDDALRFSDFAVVLPPSQADAYLPHLESVFTSFKDLPYTINSISLSSRTALLDAVETLLELPLSRFRRSDVLALLVHPNFLSRFSDIGEEQWSGWVDALNIFYGADREQQSQRGTYLEDNDFYNWDQGMKRLALGAFMSPKEGSDGVQIGEHNYRPEEVTLSELPAASALNNAVSSLLSDTLWLRSKDEPDREGYRLATWAEVFEEMIDTYIVPSKEADADWGEEMKNIERIKSALRDLADLPDIGLVSYSTALMHARDRLSTLQVGVSQKFTDGVVVSTTGRLRAIPFEHTYVLGASEGDFPASDPRSELDLRNAEEERSRGDVWPSQRDKYHFLELFQSAGSTFTLSWVGRDATAGSKLSPSSIISDLQRMVTFDHEDNVITHPLRRFDLDHYRFPGLDHEPSDKVATNHHPEAGEEARMRAIRRAIYGDERPGKTIWTGRAFQEFQSRLGRHALKMLPRLGREEEGERKTMILTLSKLRKFLQTPLQTKAEIGVSIYSDEDESQLNEREPFGFDNVSRAIIFRNGFAKAISEAVDYEDEKSLKKVIKDITDNGFRRDTLPQGVFLDSAISDVAESLGNSIRNFREQGPEKNFPWNIEIDTDLVQYVWGKNKREEGDGVKYKEVEPLRFEGLQVGGRDFDVEIRGHSQLVSRRQALVIRPTRKKYKLAKHSPECLISVLMLQATGQDWIHNVEPILDDELETAAAFVPMGYKEWTSGTYRKTFKKHVIEFDLNIITPEAAKIQLERLVREVLSLSNCLLPADVVESCIDGEVINQRDVWSAIIEKDSPDGGFGGIRTQYGPVDNYLEYPPPKDPARVLRERFRYHEKLGLLEPEGEE